MFQDIEADVYVMVDGDDTYERRRLRTLVDKLDRGEPRHGGRPRVETHQAAYRAGHRLGNRVLTGSCAGCSARKSTTCSPATACSRAGS
jgi:hypothetical protein